MRPRSELSRKGRSVSCAEINFDRPSCSKMNGRMEGESIIFDSTVTANNLQTLDKQQLINMVLTLTNTQATRRLQKSNQLKIINLEISWGRLMPYFGCVLLV